MLYGLVNDQRMVHPTDGPNSKDLSLFQLRVPSHNSGLAMSDGAGVGAGVSISPRSLRGEVVQDL